MRSAREIREATARASGHKLQVGKAALLDTFAGLVRCEVLSIADNGFGFLAVPSPEVRVRVTADHGPYKQGETLKVNVFHTIPPGCVKRRKYSSLIITSYTAEKG